MKVSDRGLIASGAGLLVALLLAAPSGAQNEPMPSVQQEPPPAGIEPRTIFVPFLTDNLNGRGARGPAGRRVVADAVWTGLTLGAAPAAPNLTSGAGSALLQEFRLSSAPRRPGEPRRFVAVVRIQPFRAGAAPLLEVADAESAIQSQAWGRLLRRAGDAADYIFIVREPIPSEPTAMSPVLRGAPDRTDREQRFNLQLSVDASPGRAASPQRTRR
jgi:hypothetical protein